MLKGKTEPRVWTPPLRELTRDTTLGYAFCDFCDAIGAELLPWQRWLAIHALEIVDEGEKWRFRFRYVLILVSRQNGKTYFEVLLNIFFLYGLRSRLVLGTAQNLDTAVETFEDTVGQVESVPELKTLLKKVNRGTGKREMLLDTGDRYKVIAATRKARGLSSDLVMMDELREQTTWEAWGAISKTMMARPTAILFGLSNAGDGTSVVLRHLRGQAHAQLGNPDGDVNPSALVAPEETNEEIDSGLAIFEWSAKPDCELNDREQWAQANPSLGYGFLTERALKTAMGTDPETVFRTECLCQWVTSTVAPPFPIGAWDAGKDERSTIADDSPLYFGIDVSSDRLHTSIAVCGKRADGAWHAELAEYRAGSGWLVKWLQNAAPNYPAGMKVALQSKGAPIASLMDVIAAIDGVEVIECCGRDVAGWCGRLYDAVSACDESSETDAVPVYHITQPALDLAANIAVTRPMGDGAWAWDRNKSIEDISPLVAVTMAFGAATQVETNKQKLYDSIYEERGVLVV